jgi:hypothetical protein
MQVSQRYGYTRPAAIAARLCALRARLVPIACAAALCGTIAPPAAPVAVEDARPLTDADAPPEMEVAPSIGTPAPLETVESLAHDYDGFQAMRAQHVLLIESHIVERETLRRDLETLHAGQCDARDYGGDFTAEIEEIESRLQTLDDYLVFEPDTPFIYGFDDLSPERLQTLVLA